MAVETHIDMKPVLRTEVLLGCVQRASELACELFEDVVALSLHAEQEVMLVLLEVTM